MLKKGLIVWILLSIIIILGLLFSGNEVSAKTTLYGDVNEDGKVDTQDIARLQQYVSRWRVSINETNADIFKDGKIDKKDIEVLKKHIAQWTEYLQLPIDGKVIYGDVNGDGKFSTKDFSILKNALMGKYSKIIKENADVNKDGKVDINDYKYLLEKAKKGESVIIPKEAKVVQKHLSKWDEYKNLPFVPEKIKVPENDKNVVYGDVNNDGKVDMQDIGRLQQYVSGWNVKINEVAADVYKDSIINKKDIDALQKHLSDWKDYKTLPYLAK